MPLWISLLPGRNFLPWVKLCTWGSFSWAGSGVEIYLFMDSHHSLKFLLVTGQMVPTINWQLKSHTHQFYWGLEHSRIVSKKHSRKRSWAWPLRSFRQTRESERSRWKSVLKNSSGKNVQKELVVLELTQKWDLQTGAMILGTESAVVLNILCVLSF